MNAPSFDAGALDRKKRQVGGPPPRRKAPQPPSEAAEPDPGAPAARAEATGEQDAARAAPAASSAPEREAAPAESAAPSPPVGESSKGRKAPKPRRQSGGQRHGTAQRRIVSLTPALKRVLDEAVDQEGLTITEWVLEAIDAHGETVIAERQREDESRSGLARPRRPRVEDQGRVSVMLYLEPAEDDAVDALRQRAGVDRSAFVRECVSRHAGQGATLRR